MARSQLINNLLSLLIASMYALLVHGGCILPNFPSNVLCYLGESETPCNGTSISVGTELSSSDKLSVSCDQGFLPKYDAGYVCVYLGPMPGFLVNPTLGDDACQAACSDPGHPALGNRSPPPSHNGYYATGDVVDFTCDADTTQSGYTSLTCQSDGQWYLGSTMVPSDQLPPDTCFLNCGDPGTPENGRKLSDDKNHGDSILFACNSGLNLIGSETVTCDNGTWSDEPPKCASVLINDVTVSIVSGDPLTANMMNSVTFTADVVSSTIGAGANGTNTWQLVVFVQKDSESTAEVVANIPQDEADQDLIAGDTLRFTVTNYMVNLAGFTCTAQTELCVRIESPQMTLHGLPDDGALTGCTPITCGCARWTDSLAQYVEERSPSVSYPVSVGQTVELTCNDTGSANGRTLFGGVGPVCQDDGTWYPRVSDFSCSGGCVLPDFPSDVRCYLGESETSCEGTSVSIDTELDSGEIFSVSCDHGFSPKYNAGYVCDPGPGPGFTVNPTLGDDACQAACADPGHPALGRRSPPPRGNGYYEPGEVVDFTCDVDTTQSGYTSLTCQSDGQWYLGSTMVSRDRLPPDNCFLNCMDLGTPKNGRKLGEDKNHRDSISFACNNGFRLIGSKTVTCDNGTWSDESPTCAKCSRNSGSIFIAIVFLLFYSEI